MVKRSRPALSQPETRRARSTSGRIRLEDVAAHAGVSTATVSRAFNEPEKVNEDVRERVLKAAEEMNWIPNAAGRALASSRTHIAGAIIPTLDNEVFAKQVSAMQAVFSERGYTLFLGCSNYDPEEGHRQVMAMLARGVEALAIVGENHPPELFRALKLAKIPFVVTYSFNPNAPYACVGFDHNAAFQVITRHLIDLGHRKFAAIFQPSQDNDRVAARLAGIREALVDASIMFDERDCLVGPPTMEFGAKSFADLMSRGASKPTAVICGNDTIAIGAIAAAGSLNVDVPGTCSITGFDDLMIASQVSPQLTTMRIDNQHIGTLAARQLLSVIDGESLQPISEELTTELRIRDSTGPAL
jgi:LacI family transcriptional regulator